MASSAEEHAAQEKTANVSESLTCIFKEYREAESSGSALAGLFLFFFFLFLFLCVCVCVCVCV